MESASLPPRSVTLLGPQRLRPTVGETLVRLGVTGGVAAITAGWQEREDEDDELLDAPRRALVQPRASTGARREVFAADPELADGHSPRGSSALRDLQRLYRLRLDHALEAVARAAARRTGSRRGCSIGAGPRPWRRCVSSTTRHLERTRGGARRVRAALAPGDAGRRCARQRTEIARSARGLRGGGDRRRARGGAAQPAAPLRRRLDCWRASAVIAWSAGAMVARRPGRAVPRHARRRGAGNAEVFEAGLGLCPDVAAAAPRAPPAAPATTRSGSPSSRERFAPAVCAALDEGGTARVDSRNGAGRPSRGRWHASSVDGSVTGGRRVADAGGDPRAACEARDRRPRRRSTASSRAAASPSSRRLHHLRLPRPGRRGAPAALDLRARRRRRPSARVERHRPLVPDPRAARPAPASSTSSRSCTGPTRRLIQDPLNPHRAHDPFGANSVCHADRLRGARSGRCPIPRRARGTLEELVVSERRASAATRRVTRLPAGALPAARARYPLLVVHDGGDYLQLRGPEDGARQPDPPARDPGDDRGADPSRRPPGASTPTTSAHARFLVEELVPRLERRAAADRRRPSARGLMGASFGAVASLAAAWRHPRILRAAAAAVRLVRLHRHRRAQPGPGLRPGGRVRERLPRRPRAASPSGSSCAAASTSR